MDRAAEWSCASIRASDIVQASGHDDAKLISTTLAAEALRAAGLIAHRLTDEEIVSEAVRRSTAAATYPYNWGGASLYGGHMGSALLFHQAALVYTDAAERWNEYARQALRRGALHTRQVPVSHRGLAAGTAGLAFAVGTCGSDLPGSQSILIKLHHRLAEQNVRSRRGWRHDDVGPSDYDVISGSSGVLGYLATVPEPNGLVRRTGELLIDDLVRMCDRKGAPNDRPWSVSPSRAPDEYAEKHRYGYVDLGLAHGVAGPLAALSQAWVTGYRRRGMFETIRRIGDYLMATAVGDSFGLNWPMQVPLDPAGGSTVASAGDRMSWCYGSPGVCSALLDAADALHDHRWRSAAIGGMEAAVRRSLAPIQQSYLTASLCHGFAGLLLLCRKFAQNTDSAEVRSALPDLTARLLACCDPALLLSVQEASTTGPPLDSPALLDGAAGVALALWSVADDADMSWQRALLLGPVAFS